MIKKDHLITGLVLGLLVPPLVFLIVYLPNETKGNYLTNAFFENLALMSIFFNGLAMWIVMNGFKLDKTGRGILLVNLMYALLFVIYFYAL
ncbi:MAG TPA: hypothetical protein DCS15_06990 [Flavobacteriales bacterium]|nr:hypothetical protein [Salibacteraceae bacterium]HAS36215.1 hypothetical protein [Flavobacteriales bacterium]